MSLTWAPGMHQSSLREGSIWHLNKGSKPCLPLRRESPTATTHLYFLMELVLIEGVGLSDLGNTSGVALESVVPGAKYTFLFFVLF